MIEFVKVDDILDIRNVVLRKGLLKPMECLFPTDNIDGAFHLGYKHDDSIVCVASFHPQCYEANTGAGYQLRGMATLAQYRGKGFGKQLVEFAISYLQTKGVTYLWCNAREVAVGFYAGLGFGVVSDVFEVKGIGPHFVMFLKLK